MRLIFIFLLFAATTLAHAQTFSVRAGLNFATQAWKYKDQNIRPGYIIGPHVNVAVTNTLKGKIGTQLGNRLYPNRVSSLLPGQCVTRFK